MITIEINGWRFALTEENESVVKKILSKYSPETKVIILETGEVLKINDIFDYEGNCINTR